MIREEKNAESNEQAAKPDVNPRTTKERAEMRKWLSQQAFGVKTTESQDRSVNILAKNENAFHALRYVFEDPSFHDDGAL